MQLDIRRGEPAKLSKLSGVPLITVRRYLGGRNVGVHAATKIDEAYKALWPERAALNPRTNDETPTIPTAAGTHTHPGASTDTTNSDPTSAEPTGTGQ